MSEQIISKQKAGQAARDLHNNFSFSEAHVNRLIKAYVAYVEEYSHKAAGDWNAGYLALRVLGWATREGKGEIRVRTMNTTVGGILDAIMRNGYTYFEIDPEDDEWFERVGNGEVVDRAGWALRQVLSLKGGQWYTDFITMAGAARCLAYTFGLDVDDLWMIRAEGYRSLVTQALKAPEGPAKLLRGIQLATSNLYGYIAGDREARERSTIQDPEEEAFRIVLTLVEVAQHYHSPFWSGKPEDMGEQIVLHGHEQDDIEIPF